MKKNHFKKKKRKCILSHTSHAVLIKRHIENDPMTIVLNLYPNPANLYRYYKCNRIYPILKVEAAFSLLPWFIDLNK